MSQLDPQTVWRWIALDERQPMKARIDAFTRITRPSLYLMRLLLAKKKARKHKKFRVIVAQRYETAMRRKELMSGARKGATAKNS